MTPEKGNRDEAIKIQFATREGTYKQMPISDHFYPKKIPYEPQVAASSITPVKTSFVKVNDEDYVCFTVGRELLYFSYNPFKQANLTEYLDKRMYKGVAPSCHAINQVTASPASVRIAVGFIAGQVQIIDIATKESLHIMNEDRSVEKSRVTCVQWYPKSENMVLSSHLSGYMYTYDVTQPCTNLTSLYHSQPYKAGDGYSIYTLKNKSTTISSTNQNGGAMSINPQYKWVLSTDGSAVHSFEFSPCGRFIAIVTQNGYLRVIDHSSFEQYGCMKSYFGGLLTCCWSPDGRYIVAGGEDDLVTVWSFCDKSVIARGKGHRSWVSKVTFDPVCCTIPSDSDMRTFYSIPSVDEVLQAAIVSKQEFSSNNATDNNVTHASDLNVKVNYKDGYQDYGLQMKLNGDPLPATSVKRLRTYSNVSKLSRLSIGLVGGAPPLCYRFGSVGQDAQLCLWELDENVLYFSQRNKSRSVAGGGREQSASSLKVEHSSSNHINGEEVEPALNGLSGSHHDSNNYQQPGANHTNGNMNYQHKLHRNDVSTSTLNSMSAPLVASSRSHSVPHSIHTSVNSTKDHRNSSKPETSTGLSMIRKFATIGSHDQSKKPPKEHKRNLSLPHFAIKNTLNGNGNSTTKMGFLKKQQPPKPVKTFGTKLCPHLDETTILEPLVCKTVANDQITCLDFKEDCVVTTCQNGYIQLWNRPNAPHKLTSQKVSSNSVKEQTKTDGTVV